MDKIIKLLWRIPLFKGLSQDQIQQVYRIAENRFYDKGRFIFAEGDEGIGFYVVAAGKVKIYKVSPDGKEQILHIYGPGNPFGEVPVFSGDNFPASAEALVKSHLLFFPRKAFVNLIVQNPSLCLNMLAVLSLRLREFTLQIENLSLKEVPGRLASYLIYLISEQGNETLVRLVISKGQLASLLGTIPETLSRIFAKMSSQGLIQVNGRNIQILNIQGLSDLARQGKLT
jgi:CRP/FNR family transcriptional regulator